MIFTEPVPFDEALNSRAVKELLPTAASSMELSAIAPELRERAFFSARVKNAELLQELDNGIDELLQGRVDVASIRTRLKEYEASIGLLPTAADAPEGPLSDITSTARLDLILDTNVRMAQGYGQWKQGQSAGVLDQWPAQELFRAEARNEEREWTGRWLGAGGTLHGGGRMIALKNDPVWTEISTFGLPYPPFDFNSGMDVRDVDRDEAIELGLIDRDTQIAPKDRPFNDGLEAGADQVAAGDSALRAQLMRDLGDVAEFVGGVLRFKRRRS